MVTGLINSQPVMRQNREKNMIGQSCSSHGHTEAESKERARDTVHLSRSCT